MSERPSSWQKWVIFGSLVSAALGFLADLGGGLETGTTIFDWLSAWLGGEGSGIPGRFRLPVFVLALCAVLLVASWVIGQVRSQRVGPERRPGSAPEESVRKTYLEYLRTDIRNRLEASIHRARFLDLGMEESPNAILPWHYQAFAPDAEPQSFASFEEAFEHFGHRVLLLGAPGAGKTTTLLHLVQHLVEAALGDPSKPVPVLLNLSSYSPKNPHRTRRPGQETRPREDLAAGNRFDTWLVQQIEGLPIRGLSRDVAWSWIDQGQLALLLDGLDEVDDEIAASLVQDLNSSALFKYPPSPAVVCSRLVEYDILRQNRDTRLRLEGAVVLQPLTTAQIETYLEAAQATGLRQALAVDTELVELAQTPLTLSLMTLAYGGLTPEKIPSHLSLLERRRHLFDTYISRMMQRQARRAAGKQFDLNPEDDVPTPYRWEELNRYLGWLAVRLSELMRSSFPPREIASLLKDWETTRHPTPPFWTPLLAARLTSVFLVGTLAAWGILSFGARSPDWPLLLPFGGLVCAGTFLLSARPSCFTFYLGFLGISLFLGTVAGAFRALLPALSPLAANALLPFALGMVLMALVDSEKFWKRFIPFILSASIALAGISLVSSQPDLLLNWIPLIGLAGLLTILAKDDGWWTAAAYIIFMSLLLFYCFLVDRMINPVPCTWSALIVVAIAGVLLAVEPSDRFAGVILGGLFGMLWQGAAGAILGTATLLAFGRSTRVRQAVHVFPTEIFLRTILALQGHLPFRCKRFFGYALEVFLLKEARGELEFLHRLLRDHLALRELALQLTDARGNVRIETVERLSRQGEAGLDALRDLSGTTDPAVRRAATASLGNLRTLKSIPVLDHILWTDSESLVRQEAVKSLGRLPIAETSTFLTKAEDHPDPEVRAEVVILFLAQHKSGSREEVAKQAFVQQHGGQPLFGDVGAKIFNAHLAKWIQDERPVARIVLREVGRWSVRADIAIIPQEHRAGLIASLRPLLQDSDLYVRIGIFRLLEKAWNFESLPWLIRACDDPDARIRAAALAALGFLNATETILKVCERLQDRNADVRKAAARTVSQLVSALSPMPPEIAGTIEHSLLQLLHDRDVMVRREAIRALEKFPSAATAGFLLDCLHDRDFSVSESAASVLQKVDEIFLPNQRLLDVLARGNVKKQLLASRVLSGRSVASLLPSLYLWSRRGSKRRRRGAALALAAMKDSAAVPGLQQMIRDRSVAFRCGLLRILGLNSTDTRLLAIEALSYLGTPEANSLLIEISWGDDIRLRLAAGELRHQRRQRWP